ncbi:MAG: Biotin carboxylase [Acidobacteria bacterium ADurb.Bin340]|nr:MAG: Biotin carboxylase [Acidobacteria bacterium ADurb.Bin340]HQL48269.1 biotin carboxylase N-terminal domain-containing protein [Holophaga sp.]
MPVTKLLIANRGEIACRIIRTCREMDIPTVAVYSDADRGGMHVRLAVWSFPIGPTPSRESYMRVDRILEVAKRTGADALHPGYGFFSEDPEAAQKVLDAGLTWIGPSPEALRIMGDKVQAREFAQKLGIPVLPGIHEAMDDEALIQKARELDYPLMVKPVVGRDGKGLRMARTEAELRRALPRVKGDAVFSFWDDRIYLEKMLPKARHIEVQVFGDTHGNYVYLWERDGSVQRRFQQVAEEAPSPFVTPELRTQLGEAAVALARALNYVGAGTVEFLLDEDHRFYFLEMTCRIQGSHGLTEWITGEDLVRWQVRVARGEALPLRQEEIPLRGHAIQCRMNAEDPDRDWAPSSGRLNYLRLPSGRNVRNDSGVYPGWELNPFYAPILSKLSTWGPNRDLALARMHAALSEYRIGGVRNNTAFHKALTEHRPFLKGDYHTGILDHPWWKQRGIGPNLKFAVAVALFDELEREEQRAQQPAGGTGSQAWKLHGRINRL